MTGQNKKSARAVAAAVLKGLDPCKEHASAALNRFLTQTGEKQRATDLVFGTIRNRSAIDLVISELASRPAKRIPDNILNVIRIGVYELIYCPETALHAVVNEAVESVKTFAGKKQAGFVNAVLRQIIRQIKNRTVALAAADVTSTLPLSADSGCEFETGILPDPANQQAEYLSSAFSLPIWLIQQWLADHGFDKAMEICHAGNRKPAIHIRANTLVITAEALKQKLDAAHIDSEIIEGDFIRLKSPASVTQLPGFNEGLFSVQDITASIPARLLDPQPDTKILDLCAAPGGKTTQLAELTKDNASIFATDIDTIRLKQLNENIERLNLRSVTVIDYKNLQKTADQIGAFDSILLDVPCSNTGVLARRPEVRYRINQKALEAITKTQAAILEQASKLVKTGGKICYSTCSIQNDENGLLVRRFLEKYSFELKAEIATLPSARKDCDGGYAAILIKTENCNGAVKNTDFIA
ncbi:MAG: 16S rRNA (cytosine(967)-C(5))-methyltransferase RsmB [Candidatus Brocadiia bacterium]|nr:MAG: 16S rRNA (cytosine(967)-C(5))-methyltransferase RsmB [Candidatus Brocadiia bacterium]